MKYRSYSPDLARLYGKKPSKVDRMIQMRSALSHTEIQFSERYGNISFSATMQDGCKCARFKMIAYSHPERWLTVDLDMTNEQEDAVFKKCCEMADLGVEMAKAFILHPIEGYKESENCTIFPRTVGMYYGSNALKYDLAAVSFSFITKWNIWRGAKKKVFCTESCFIALMEAWPEMLYFKYRNTVEVTHDRKGEPMYDSGIKELTPDQLHPSLGDMVIRDYVRRQE